MGREDRVISSAGRPGDGLGAVIKDGLQGGIRKPTDGLFHVLSFDPCRQKVLAGEGRHQRGGTGGVTTGQMDPKRLVFRQRHGLASPSLAPGCEAIDPDGVTP